MLDNKIGDLLIDFGRSPFWNCPAPEDPTPNTAVTPINQRRPTQPTTEEVPWSALEGNAVGANSHPLPKTTVAPTLPPSIANKRPWYIPAIECNEPENHVFYAHLGPSGGSQGYNAITGSLSFVFFFFWFSITK